MALDSIPELRRSADGSSTVFSPRFDALYHSHHGALRETRHVFVGAGLQYVAQFRTTIDVLELGFGTGLNAAASWVLAKAPRAQGLPHPIRIHYVGIELFPLPQNLLSGFASGDTDIDRALAALHVPAWPSHTELDAHFRLEKRLAPIEAIQEVSAYDCIYHDAFAPQTQPELWTAPMFERLHASLRPGGVLVTYCAQGQVRRNMRAAGFRVEKMVGPPGKREMTRAHRE